MKEVRIRDRLEAPDCRVEEDDPKADPDARCVARPQEGVEGFTRRGELCGGVRHYHAENDDRGDPAERVRGVPKAFGQIVGHRDGVVTVRVLLERARHPDPRAGDTEHLAHDDPEGMHTDRVPHTGEPEEQPGALTRRVRAEGDHPRRQFLPRDIVALQVTRFAPAPEADRKQDQQIADDDAEDRG